MAAAFEVKGLEDLQKRLRDFPKKLPSSIGAEFKDLVNRMERGAKRDAPKDQGKLSSGIKTKKMDALNYALVAEANYSGYLEFGTKTKVSIPTGLEEIANSIKGKTGSLGRRELFNRILQWVHRTGIAGTLFNIKTRKRSRGRITQYAEDYIVAERIYWKIVKYGISPHPYFFKQLTDSEINKTVGNVTKILNTI